MQISGIRQSTASRNAKGLLSARALWTQYNYSKKFSKPKKGARAAGHRFEDQVVKVLNERYSEFTFGIPFEYSTIYNPRSICIPDGFFVFPDEIIIAEIKLRHTKDAWFQLRCLYQPVLQKALRRPVRLLEICKWYNPDEKFPEPCSVVRTLEAFKASTTGVGSWLWGKP